MLLGVIHNDHHMEGRCAVVDRIRAFFTYVPHVSLLPLECVLIKPYGGVSIIRFIEAPTFTRDVAGS